MCVCSNTRAHTPDHQHQRKHVQKHTHPCATCAHHQQPTLHSKIRSRVEHVPYAEPNPPDAPPETALNRRWQSLSTYITSLCLHYVRYIRTVPSASMYADVHTYTLAGMFKASNTDYVCMCGWCYSAVAPAVHRLSATSWPVGTIQPTEDSHATLYNIAT